MNRSDARIYLLGPSSLERLAYRRLLETDLNCCVQTESGFEATSVWAALRNAHDLALINCDQPSLEIIDAVQMIPRLQPRTRLLLLTSRTDEAGLSPWRSCAVDGILLKDGGLTELALGIDALLHGRKFMSEDVRRAMISATVTDSRTRLSRRETELLPLLASGLRLQDAAERMQISYKTADSYRTSLLRKLGLRDRVELARYAIREKIISP